MYVNNQVQFFIWQLIACITIEIDYVSNLLLCVNSQIKLKNLILILVSEKMDLKFESMRVFLNLKAERIFETELCPFEWEYFWITFESLKIFLTIDIKVERYFCNLV